MTKAMTNVISQTSFAENIFNCEFCGYQSKLDLSECPGCGRLRSNSKMPKNPRGKTLGFQSANFTAVSENMTRFAQKNVYQCRHCRYQTPNRIGECPECGRQELVETLAAIEIFNADSNNQKIEIDKSALGTYLLALGLGSLWIAGEAYLGYGPSPHDIEVTMRVAAPGEQWLGALILASFGIVLFIAGAWLKMDN
jgi:RNA polymerase subunit RPABC4/transcription elongation factor Spt4